MNSNYRWVIVAAGAFMDCVAIGSIFSLPVFLQPMSAATGWSRTAISLAMTLGFISMGIASFGWGMLMDRVGPRIVLLAGSRPGAGKPCVHG
jgi:MFS family permease